jgi:hypothetical protein
VSFNLLWSECRMLYRTFNTSLPTNSMATFFTGTTSATSSVAYTTTGAASALTEAKTSDYRQVPIPKFKRVRNRKVINGTRILTIPNPVLMAKQREILASLKQRGIPPSSSSHAYVEGRDIRSMAKPHVGKKHLVRIDIKDFFPSVTFRSVRTGLIYWNVPQNLQIEIRKFAFYSDGLPQGSPISPILSNMAMGHFDGYIRAFLKSWRKDARSVESGHFRSEPIEYTRYADDLVFSSNYPDLFAIQTRVIKILRRFGYAVNRKKIFCLSSPHRMEVCGVVVNDKLSKSRGYRRDLRATLHRIITDRSNLGKARNFNGRYDEINFSSLNSKVAHVSYVCPSQGEPLQRMLVMAREVHTLPNQQWSEQTKQYANRTRKNHSTT